MASGGDVVDGPQRGEKIAAGEGHIGWSDGGWGLGCGVRGTWQRARDAVAAFRDWTVFGTLNYGYHGRL
jgi:hypothetical protein